VAKPSPKLLPHLLEGFGEAKPPEARRAALRQVVGSRGDEAFPKLLPHLLEGFGETKPPRYPLFPRLCGCFAAAEPREKEEKGS